MPELALAPAGELEEEEEEFIDETIGERLWALSEMFPQCIRNFTHDLGSLSWKGTKMCASYSKTGLWLMTSTFTILILPALFEKERAAMQEQQLQQQRQILLGPNAAVSGQQPGMSGMMGVMPPGQ